MTIKTPDTPRRTCVSTQLLRDLEASIIEPEAGLSAPNQIIDTDRSDEAGIAIAWVACKIRRDVADASRIYHQLRRPAASDQEAAR